MGYVQSALDILFLLAGILHGAVGTSSTAEDSHLDPGPVRRGLSIDTSSADTLHAALQNDGWIYNLLDQVDVSSLNLKKRNSDPRMTQRLIARNMTLDDQGSASDIAFNYFDNGDLNLHFPGGAGTFPTGNAQDSPLHTRFDGAGFRSPPLPVGGRRWLATSRRPWLTKLQRIGRRMHTLIRWLITWDW